jgi:hypothetical protein
VPTITQAGKLPPGVRFTKGENGTATIYGTPRGTANGIYLLTFTAKNQSGKATQAFTLTIDRAPRIKKIRNSTGRTGSALNLPITTTGYPAPVLAESGDLPSGLAFTDHRNGTAAITGVPAAGSGGRYSITVTATNAYGTASQTFTLRVRQSRRAATLTNPLTAAARPASRPPATPLPGTPAAGPTPPRMPRSGRCLSPTSLWSFNSGMPRQPRPHAG